MARLAGRRLCVFCAGFSALLFLFITLQVVLQLGEFEVQQLGPLVQGGQRGAEAWSTSTHLPVVLWWSPLTGETGRVGECGANRCFFTINKSYHTHPDTHAFLFYGTDFSAESLPLPRKAGHHWALFHEESPKNNYKLFHEPVITLFNHTATFSRHSQLPLTTQHLQSLQALSSRELLLPLERKNTLRRTLAPVAYVQSDCDPPSDRDSFVRELMRYLPVDSYGGCLHNRNLPKALRDPAAMDQPAFLRLLAQYKFMLAFENAVCDDYITEKLWRPLQLGVVPVYMGAPNVELWLPSKRSAVVVQPGQSPHELAQYLLQLDKDDSQYLAFLEWKLKPQIPNQHLLVTMRERKWGVQDVTQDSHIDAFECMVCNSVWENFHRKKEGLPHKTWQAHASHLSCPPPTLFTFRRSPSSSSSSSLRGLWGPSYQQSRKEARALRLLVERNRNFTMKQFWTHVFS